MKQINTSRTTLTVVRTGLLLLAALAMAAPAAMSQELTWGGVLEGSGSATFADHLDDPETEFSFVSALWLESLFTPNEETSIELAVQPSYTWTDDRPYLFDLDRAVADMRFSEIAGPSSVLRGQVGRFRLAGPSNLIINDTVDGLDFTLSLPAVRVRLASAYTGLLLNPSSNIRMSGADDADSGDDDEFFGPRRLLALASVAFPEFAIRQTGTLAYLGQWDLRDADPGEDTINSHYFGFTVDGPIVPGLFQDVEFFLSPATGEVEGAEGSETVLGYLASARLRYFRGDWNASRFGLRGVIVSGAGGDDDNFYTIAEREATIVADIPLQNVAYGEFTYGVRPFAGADSRSFRDIQTSLTSRVLFRVNTDQPVDTFGASVSKDGAYIGTDLSLQIGWRILSDVGASVTGGAFFPGTGSSAVFSDERKPEYLVRAQISASF